MQFSCSLQFVDDNLAEQNVFIGFYSPPDSISQLLFSCIKDGFTNLSLPLEKLSGYCLDRASNMSGLTNGVQPKLNAECPQSLYVYCCNHALELVLQEVTNEANLIAEESNFVQSVAMVIGESHKRKTLFKSLFGLNEVVKHLSSLRLTR